jgi:hypothetical protein
VANRLTTANLKYTWGRSLLSEKRPGVPAKVRQLSMSIREGANVHGQRFNVTGEPIRRRADAVIRPGGAHGLRRLGGVMAPSVVDALASAITLQEGGPGSLNYRNNNPGNLRFVGQTGAVLGEGGFARWSTWDEGVYALKAQINLDATRGTDAAGHPTTTVGELIASWAPASENDTAGYIAAVEQHTGLRSSDSLLGLQWDGAAASPDSLAFSAVDYGTPAAEWGAVASASLIPVSGSLPDLAIGLGVGAALWLAFRVFG